MWLDLECQIEIVGFSRRRPNPHSLPQSDIHFTLFFGSKIAKNDEQSQDPSFVIV